MMLLFGFDWRILLLSPFIGGLAFTIARVRAYYGTRLFKRIVPQPDLVRGREEVRQAEPGVPTFRHAVTRGLLDLRFLARFAVDR